MSQVLTNLAHSVYCKPSIKPPRGGGGLIEKGRLFEGGGGGLMKCNKDNGIILL